MGIITLEFADMDAAFKVQMVAIMTFCVAEIVELSGLRVELQVRNDSCGRFSLVAEDLQA